PRRAHDVKRGEHHLSWSVAGGVDVGHEPRPRSRARAARAWVVRDPFALRREDPSRSGGFEDLCGAVDAGAQVTSVERRELVANHGLSVTPDADLAAVAVAQQHADRD